MKFFLDPANTCITVNSTNHTKTVCVWLLCCRRDIVQHSMPTLHIILWRPFHESQCQQLTQLFLSRGTMQYYIMSLT